MNPPSIIAILFLVSAAQLQVIAIKQRRILLKPFSPLRINPWNNL